MLLQAHDEVGLQGIDRTLSRLRSADVDNYVASCFSADVDNYVASCFSADVDNYVASCLKCQKAKLHPCKARLQNIPIGKTMQLIQVDVLEVLTSTIVNRYLLVAEEAISKWLECVPIKNQTGETITTIIVEISSRLGIHEFLHSDQGRNFESKLLK